jgi:hypothetical protein
MHSTSLLLKQCSVSKFYYKIYHFRQPINIQIWQRFKIWSVIFEGGGPALWYSGQSSWRQIQRSQVQFQELPDFLRSNGSGMGSTQPRELLGRNSSGSVLENREYGCGDPLH